MSKSKHSQTVESINHYIQLGKIKKILHLRSEGYAEKGRYMLSNGKRYLNFGSYSYLNLGQHEALVNAASETARKYGVQFGITRALCSIDLYDQLESNLELIFNNPVTVFPSVTLTHLAVLPNIIDNNDLVIVDQFAHASIQSTLKMLHHRGVRTELIRHNDLFKLEELILKNRDKAGKIWYLIDGIYSMYGDYPPLEKLIHLLNQYEQFNLYVDDSHGMSWTGKNGCGFVLDMVDLHPRLMLVTSLNKAFSGVGGVVVTKNEYFRQVIRNCGGPFIYSAPILNTSLGINIASSEIHLSNEIAEVQYSLKSKINAASNLVNLYGLPDLSHNNSPIFFIATGLPKVCFNLHQRLMNEGIYTSIGIFPAVPPKCTGIRICINNAVEFQDVQKLFDVLEFHLPLAYKEENYDPENINKAFRKKIIKSGFGYKVNEKTKLQYYQYDSIEQVDPQLWDSLLGMRGSFDWNGLRFLEKAFSGNAEPENNWKFIYLLITDTEDRPVLATFFTIAVSKDDLFADTKTSMKVENERKKDPYYLCSKTLIMGSLLTYGNHLYVDRDSELYIDALSLMLRKISYISDMEGINSTVLRDFSNIEEPLEELLFSEGFYKLMTPDMHYLKKQTWESNEGFVESLVSKKHRYHARINFLEDEKLFKVSIRTNASESEVKKWQELYLNIKNKSFEVNTFELTFNILYSMSNQPGWEVIELSSKDDNAVLGVLWCFKTKNTFNPMIIGIDTSHPDSLKIYKQLVFQMVKRARVLGVEVTYMGFGASLEKRRVGAIAVPSCCYVQSNDDFTGKILELLTESSKTNPPENIRVLQSNI